VSGKLVYDELNKDNDLACTNNLTKIAGTDPHEMDNVPIFLIDRGNCTFVKKVKNVQNSGGHVAIIIDNTKEAVDSIIMADDGNGKDVRIPGLLISQDAGEIIKAYISMNNDKKDSIYVEVTFEMEHFSNIVNYDFFFTADNENIYKLFIEFYFYHREIEYSSVFTPHYVTYQSSQFINPNDRKIITNCLGSGRYCINPKGNLTDGTVAVFEAIKQKCLHTYAYRENKSEIYWLYMMQFYQACILPAKFTRDCSSKLDQDMSIDNEQINKCIYESFNATAEERKDADYQKKVPNFLLDADNESRKSYMLSFIPSILVNNRTFWGSWRADNIFEAICAGYLSKPEVCYSLPEFAQAKSSLSTLSIVFIIILVIIINVILFIVCRNYIRRRIVEKIESTDINHKINTVVTSYLALRDSK